MIANVGWFITCVMFVTLDASAATLAFLKRSEDSVGQRLLKVVCSVWATERLCRRLHLFRMDVRRLVCVS